MVVLDGQRFDDLVKRFGTTRLTRVSVIRGVAAGALAAVTGVKAGSDRTVEAQGSSCRGEGVNCEGGAQVCCAGLVCNGLENPTSAASAAGRVSSAARGVGAPPPQVCLPSGTCGPAVTTPCGRPASRAARRTTPVSPP